jgi:PleD family two-component response regulator
MSVSVGVAHCRAGVLGRRELYAAADRALYRAKRGGRGRVEVTSA